MGGVKLDDDLHKIIKDKLKQLSFRIEYKDAKGFVDKAVYRFLVDLGFLKEEKSKK